MVVVATFSKPEEAHLLRMRLEAGGIQAFLRDENTIQVDWLYSNALGGVRVEVAEEDVAATRELLAADHGISAQDSESIGEPSDE
jgi:Putative prokaryotic signal transducing protein